MKVYIKYDTISNFTEYYSKNIRELEVNACISCSRYDFDFVCGISGYERHFGCFNGDWYSYRSVLTQSRLIDYCKNWRPI